MGRRRGWVAAVLILLLAAVVVGWAAPEEEPPLALTDSSGQGLDLEKLDVRVAAHGPLALTELEMVFRNPVPRRIEGRFACALPAGATLSRFAKEVDGKLAESEVVERLRATQVYTEILHTMQDPALLEQDQGNRFRARIFPILPKASTRVIISYTTVNAIGSDGKRRITVPLRGMSKIALFKLLARCRPLPGEAIQLADASGEVRPLISKDRVTFAEEMERKAFQPKEDLVLAFTPSADARPAQRLVAGDFQVAMFRPLAPEAAPPPRTDNILILADTSASQAVSGAARLKALAKTVDLLEEVNKGAALTVEAFDLGVAPILAYKAGEGKSAAVVKALEDRHFLGATDLSKALAHAGEWARGAKGPSRVILVTDAIATMGTKETGDLVRTLGAWPTTSQLHVLAIGSVLDLSAAQAIAEAGHGRVVTLPLTTAWEGAAKIAADQLARPRGPEYQAYDEAAEWIEPRKFPDVEPGAELITFSKRKDGAAAEVGVTAGKGTELRASDGPLSAPEFAPLLEREAYRAQVALLEKQENATTDEKKRAELRQKRLEISVQHRIVCPLTSMLVLESDADFERYGIERRGLADIMVVGEKGIQLIKQAAPRSSPKRADADSQEHSQGWAHAKRSGHSGTFDFEFKDAEIAKIFNAIAEQGGFKVVVDPRVRQKMTATMKKVEPNEALDTIARLNGLKVKKLTSSRGDVTYAVAPPDIIEMGFESANVRAIQLKYARAEDVQGLLAKGLSGDANVRVDRDTRTNTIVLRGNDDAIGRATELIRDVDRGDAGHESARTPAMAASQSARYRVARDSRVTASFSDEHVRLEGQQLSGNDIGYYALVGQGAARRGSHARAPLPEDLRRFDPNNTGVVTSNEQSLGFDWGSGVGGVAPASPTQARSNESRASGMLQRTFNSAESELPPAQQQIPLSTVAAQLRTQGLEVSPARASPAPSPSPAATTGSTHAQSGAVGTMHGYSGVSDDEDAVFYGGSQPRIEAPDWVRQANRPPTQSQLEALRKAVAARPFDLAARNQLALALLHGGESRELLAQALDWQPADPDNPMVYEYAGDAYARLHDEANALRAYSSIAEVSPGDSGLLNRSGFLALKAGETEMAETLFRFALERRPDHANNYRGLALTLWSAGRYEDAAKTLADALGREYDSRYHDVHRILREELSYVLSAWLAADPSAKSKVQLFIDKWHADLAYRDALRVTLHWETDANDVDLHVVDPAGEECYYSHKLNASGVKLYEDLTQGLGPECTVVPPGKLMKGVYHVGVNYYSPGPMGVSRGVVVIQRPTVKGKPNVQVETFCLLPDLQGGKDMRHIAVVETAGE